MVDIFVELLGLRGLRRLGSEQTRPRHVRHIPRKPTPSNLANTNSGSNLQVLFFSSCFCLKRKAFNVGFNVDMSKCPNHTHHTPILSNFLKQGQSDNLPFPSFPNHFRIISSSLAPRVSRILSFPSSCKAPWDTSCAL